MTKDEMERKIAELENRIADLERRPVYYPAPFYIPIPPPAAPYPYHWGWQVTSGDKT